VACLVYSERRGATLRSGTGWENSSPRVALTSADRSGPGGAAAFVVRHDCAPTTLPAKRRHQYSYTTHTTRCPAGESILSPRATQPSLPPPPDPHATRGGTIIITINIIYTCAERKACHRRRCSFLAAPGDLVGGGEERAQWKSTDLGRCRCRRHHHRVIYLAVVLIPHTHPAAQTTWAASTSSRCAPRWDFDLVAFHVVVPPPFKHYYYSIYPLCYTRHRPFSRI